MLHRVRRLVVREDLVDTEDDVGEEQRALHWIAPPTTDSPSTEDNRTGNRNSDKGRIYIGDLGELQNAPEEVDGARNDGRRENEKANLS